MDRKRIKKLYKGIEKAIQEKKKVTLEARTQEEPKEKVNILHKRGGFFK
jgi:hypothetical protein